jgi:hypothetical protein
MRAAAPVCMNACRDKPWLPNVDSNLRSRLGESAGSMFSDIVGYSRLARQSAVSCLTGGAVRECSGWARVSLRSVSIYMDDCSIRELRAEKGVPQVKAHRVGNCAVAICENLCGTLILPVMNNTFHQLGAAGSRYCFEKIAGL